MEDLYSKYLECDGRVTTDSRAVKGGELFFAIKGENFDGNAFALKAIESGARYAVVQRGFFQEKRKELIEVEDTYQALKELAICHRKHLEIPVIGLTGTNGKTTTKELIREVLSRKFRVSATEGNLNNDLGVPLTILKIGREAQIAVVEMGASHPGDIDKLVEISQPDYGLITTVGKAHLLGFGSFEGAKRTKGELYRYLSSKEGSVVFLNSDDPDLKQMASQWVKSHIWEYGIRYQNAEILPATTENPFARIRLDGQIIESHLVGSYNAINIMAAIAVGDYFGVERVEAVKAVSDYIPVNNRSQMMNTGRNVLIVDAYNANPSSMSAALDNFALIRAPKKLALLGDMRELGADSTQEHETIVRKTSGADYETMFVGEEFGKVTSSFADADALRAYLEENPVTGATILIKGSHSIQMEKLISVL